MKLMENFKVAYDTTVRDADGSIVQFKYGDDGYDAVSVVRLPIPEILEPYKRWGFDHDDEMAIIREIDNLESASNYLNWWKTEHGEFLVPCPVDVESLFERAKIMSSGGSLSISFNIVWKRCWELISKISNELFRNYLLLFLQVRRMRELTEELFDLFLNSVEDTIERSKISPGEMVGILSGQSIAE